MFRASKNTQIDLFDNLSNSLSLRKQKSFDNPSSWHNVFYSEVVSKIDEEIFSVLYDSSQGRPNASIRVLVGMLILKEGNGWSDEQLFDNCRFNLKVMSSLGLTSLKQEVPVESTYYEFKRLLTTYHFEEGVDLLELGFHNLTVQQVATHQVSGKKIRLDSKLLNSNIKVCTRLDLILSSISKFIKPLDVSVLESLLQESNFTLLTKLGFKTATNLTYALTVSEKSELLEDLGYLLQFLLCYYYFSQPAYYDLLARLYEDQYQLISQNNDSGKDQDNQASASLLAGMIPIPKESKSIDSGSLQSIHDPEACFRSKGKGSSQQKVAGYHANITETCDEANEINLILEVSVKPANVSEDIFLLPSIQESESILQEASLIQHPEKTPEQIIEVSITDGGYDSKANRIAMCQAEMPNWELSKTKGKPLRFFLWYDKNKQLQAKEKQTGKKCEVTYSIKADKQVLKLEGKAVRYLTDQEVENYLLIQQIQENQKAENKKLRANVEASIHQVFHRVKKRNKIMYRGLYKCKTYVLSRAFWTNFKRIHKKAVNISLYLFNICFSALSALIMNESNNLQL